MPDIPITAIATNQTSMMGPKKCPIAAVPLDWIANSASRIATAAGTTYGCKAGVAMLTPSSADSTEMAGVIAPSP